MWTRPGRAKAGGAQLRELDAPAKRHLDATARGPAAPSAPRPRPEARADPGLLVKRSGARKPAARVALSPPPRAYERRRQTQAAADPGQEPRAKAPAQAHRDVHEGRGHHRCPLLIGGDRVGLTSRALRARGQLAGRLGTSRGRVGRGRRRRPVPGGAVALSLARARECANVHRGIEREPDDEARGLGQQAAVARPQLASHGSSSGGDGQRQAVAPSVLDKRSLDDRPNFERAGRTAQRRQGRGDVGPYCRLVGTLGGRTPLEPQRARQRSGRRRGRGHAQPPQDPQRPEAAHGPVSSQGCPLDKALALTDPTGAARRARGGPVPAYSASNACTRASISVTLNEFLIERICRSLPITTSRGYG